MKFLINILKFVFPVIAIGTFVYLIYACWFVATFHGDIYGKAEAYVIDIETYENGKFATSSDILDLLYEFQSLHPQYRLMDTDRDGIIYHNFSDKIDNREDQYTVMFYFEDIDMIFCCVTAVTNKNNPLIKLFYVNEGSIVRHPEEINNYKEISRKKNKVMKKKFETEILDNLGVKWRHRRFWD